MTSAIFKPVVELGDKVIANPWVRWSAKIHIQQDCCCYLISTAMGVNIISIGLIVSLLEEYFSPNFARGMLKVAMIVPMVLMYIKDNSFHRWLYLQLFCFCQPLVAIVNLFAYQNILVDNVMFAKGLCWLSQEWIHFSQPSFDALNAILIEVLSTMAQAVSPKGFRKVISQSASRERTLYCNGIITSSALIKKEKRPTPATTVKKMTSARPIRISAQSSQVVP